MMFKNKYRIVTDNYLGYEVQIRRWYFPVWFQCFKHGQPSNTHATIEKAEAFAREHAASYIVKSFYPS